MLSLIDVPGRPALLRGGRHGGGVDLEERRSGRERDREWGKEGKL